MHALTALGLVLCLSAADVLGCGGSNRDEQIAAATEAEESEPRTWSSRGQITAIPEAKDRVTIAHEDIEGYMPAMTMPFFTDDPAVLEGLAAGDTVEFTFRAEEGGRHVIVSIQK